MALEPSDEALANIRDKILLRGQSALFGAQLGALIKAEVPGLDFKPHGGLREFSNKYLSRFVSWNGRREGDGSDDLYAVVHETEHATTCDLDWSPVGIPPVEHAWLTFVSTTSRRRLAFSPSTGGLNVSKHGFEGDVPSGFVEVPCATAQELRQAVETFLSQVPTEEKPIFSDILAEEANYYNKWLSALRTSADKKLSVKWTHHRIAFLLSLFKTRLIKIGATESQADELEKHLRDSQNEANRARKRGASPVLGPLIQLAKVESPVSTEQLSGGSRPEEESMLRLVIQDAIQSMSAEQLRELSVPVGLVMDAVYRLRNTSK